MEHMNADKFKSTMNSLAYGGVMAAAARDLQKEMLANAATAAPTGRDVDIDDLLDDPELEKLHADRLASLRQEAERRAATDPAVTGRRPGEVETLTEAELVAAAAAAPRLVAHFYHDGFGRCAILDRHLAALAATHTRTRFVRVSAPDCPFLTSRLNVRVLPALLSFVGGTCVGRCVGFDDYQPSSRRTAAISTSGLPSFNASTRPDAFPTAAVEARLVEHGSVSLADAAAARAAAAAAADGCGDALPAEHARRAVRKGGRGRGRGGGSSDADDSGSDWSD